MSRLSQVKLDSAYGWQDVTSVSRGGLVQSLLLLSGVLMWLVEWVRLCMSCCGVGRDDNRSGPAKQKAPGRRWTMLNKC
jgi:hypothetical protein